MRYQPPFPPADTKAEIKRHVLQASPRKATLWQSASNAWVRLTGPAAERFSQSTADQERLRRSRLLCAMFTLIPFAVVANVPIALTRPVYWITLSTLSLVSLLAVFANRRGRVTTSGLLFIFSIDFTLTVLMATQPHGIRTGNIPDFDIFVFTILIAGTVLPRRILPFLAISNCIIILALFTLLPHDPLLTQEIIVNQKGLGYAELSDAFLLQIGGATIAYLSSWSIAHAQTRANLAEELAEARALLNKQNQRELEQKERLEHGISILKETQARVANGDYSARARLQDNELAPLALSFNLLIERLSRIPRLEKDSQRMEIALQQFIEMLTTRESGETSKPFQPTGTIADRLSPMIERAVRQNHMIAQTTISMEKVFMSLQQQSGELSRLDGILLQTRTIVQMRAYETPSPSTTQEKTTGPLQPTQRPRPVTDRLNTTLAPVIDEAIKRSTRANELGKQSLQEIKQLGQVFRNA